MAKPITIPNTFANATTAIPLSQLDNNYSTITASINDANTYSNYAADSGSANAYVVALANVSTTYTAGLRIQFKAANTNSGASTLNVNSQGAKNIYLNNAAVSANVIQANAVIDCIYDGTQFQIISNPGTLPSVPVTVAQGGTGQTSLTANNVVLGNGTSAVQFVAPGTNGNVLTSNGTTWISQAQGAATGNVTIGNTTVALGGTTSNLGNVTLLNTTVTNYTETLYSANSSTAITINLSNGTFQYITLTGTATITMPTVGAGKSFILLLAQDATGGRTVTWSTVVWPGGTAPTITSTASKKDLYSFFSDGTNWYGVTVSQNY